MSVEPRLVFMNAQNISKAHSVENILDTFLAAEFDVYALKVGNYNQTFAEWDKYPGVSTGELSLVYQRKQLSFKARNVQTSLELLVQLGWGQRHLGREERTWSSATCFQSSLFHRDGEDPLTVSMLFLDLGKRLYQVILPTFGWLDMSSGLAGYTSFEDVETLALPHLYWANFFSPSYVEKIGRSKIQSAPAWSLEELPDGGLVYVLSSSPGLSSEGHVPIEKVKAHFGVTSVR